MAVSSFQDLPLAEDEPNQKYHDAQDTRGGVNLPDSDIDRVKSHLAKDDEKMGESGPWEQ